MTSRACVQLSVEHCTLIWRSFEGKHESFRGHIFNCIVEVCALMARVSHVLTLCTDRRLHAAAADSALLEGHLALAH
jgi:hypothetical protein